MSAKAHNLAHSEDLLDLNEANATQLQSLLPGIGNVLASRIVAYRDEHGPFENPGDLTRVSGIGDRLLSKLAPRLSVAPSMGPTSGYSVTSRPAPRSLSEEPGSEAAFFASASAYPFEKRLSYPTTEDAFRSPGAPDLETLLRRGASPEVVVQDHDHNQLTPFVETEAFASGEMIPLQRPWKVWLVVGGIALMSAAVGSIYGIRSQDGGPRAVLERHVIRTIDQVADLKTSVKALEEQTTAFAGSINALDARLSERERPIVAPAKRPAPLSRPADAHPAETDVHADPMRPAPERRGTAPEVRENVRQALRALDPFLSRSRMDRPESIDP